MQNDKIKKDDKERIVFDAIVSNPPYQVTKGGTKNVNVWQHFVKVANLCGAKWVSMIHPGSWVVPKAQMESVRDEMLEMGMTKFNYNGNASQIFPNINATGGITITNYKKDYKGKPNCFINGEDKGTYSKDMLFTTNPFEDEIVKQFCSLSQFTEKIKKRVLGNEGALGGGFGYNKQKHISLLKTSKTGMKNPIQIYASGKFATGGGSRKEWFYIDSKNITIEPKEVLSKRKLMISKNGDLAGGYRQNPMIVDKNCIGENVFFILPENDTDYELKLLQSYLATKTFRYILSLKMKDQCVRGFENIPDYTYFMDDMKDPKYNNKLFENKLGLLTDEYFYKKFNFSQELIDYIEKTLNIKELV